MNEIDFLMRVDAEGVITYENDTMAKQARLDEWLNTPEGSVYGMPSWGHPIFDFKHEPTGHEYLAVLLESTLSKKLRVDLPEINLSGINCYPANDLPELGGKGGFIIEVITPDFTHKDVKGMSNG